MIITAFELAQFAEKNGWIAVERSKEDEEEDYIRFLTPSGLRVLVTFNQDGSIFRVYP